MLSSPFQFLFSFGKVIDILEQIAQSDVDYRANYAKALIEQVRLKKEFRDGINDIATIEQNKDLIKNILADLFPTALTHNEIKAVALPFQNYIFNETERFKKILNEAGNQFDILIRDFNEELFYKMNCILILNTYYGQKLDFQRLLFYDIPDASGVLKHYRILYNADFIEINPKNNFIHPTQDIIIELIDNFDTIEIWKKHFPPNSWIMKGFVIMTLIDVTIESAVSNLKSNLLKPYDNNNEFEESFESIFKSILKVSDIKIGFTMFNEEEDIFENLNKDDKFKSIILLNENESDCKNALCGCTFDYLFREKKTFVISNVEKLLVDDKNKKLVQNLLNQNIRSFLIAPVIKNGKLLGLIEIGSAEIRGLNSINVNKIDLVIPYFADTIERNYLDLQNQVEAIIQKEYTAIHSSVYWKFKKEAFDYVKSKEHLKNHVFKEISFKEVYPLYGQIDIKGSSDQRNETIKTDLKNQLSFLIQLLEQLGKFTSLLIIQQHTFELNEFIIQLNNPLQTDTEQGIRNFIESAIHPLLRSIKDNEEFIKNVTTYFSKLDSQTGMLYQSRKDFDQTLFEINKTMANVIDNKQEEAQKIFPHYYERFKTDGVEHNLYIGNSITPNLNFDKIYVSNLRLWQLETLCEMELEHHKIKKTLPYPLEVTLLILVFNNPISIRFRMDEKRFDVDGSYNARYEVIKKRIDKANIKGTSKRITEKEKITIVYTQKHEEEEYKKYIKFLQHKNILEKDIEKFEIEDLQGVSGLKGLRVKVKND